MIAASQKLSVKEKIGYSLGDLAANLVSRGLAPRVRRGCSDEECRAADRTR